MLLFSVKNPLLVYTGLYPQACHLLVPNFASAPDWWFVILSLPLTLFARVDLVCNAVMFPSVTLIKVFDSREARNNLMGSSLKSHLFDWCHSALILPQLTLVASCTLLTWCSQGPGHLRQQTWSHDSAQIGSARQCNAPGYKPSDVLPTYLLLDQDAFTGSAASHLFDAAAPTLISKQNQELILEEWHL